MNTKVLLYHTVHVGFYEEKKKVNSSAFFSNALRIKFAWDPLSLFLACRLLFMFLASNYFFLFPRQTQIQSKLFYFINIILESKSFILLHTSFYCFLIHASCFSIHVCYCSSILDVIFIGRERN